MSREMGKVLAEAGGDVQEAIDMSYYMAGEGRRLFGHTTPSELPDKFQMSVRQPIGVVGVITPWNFPIAIPSWKIVPALVCGNTVVFKPANDTPMLGQRFVELLVEAGVPDGVVNLVHGFGREVGDRIVRHPDVRVVTLTGSRETGRRGAGGRRREPQARAPRARRQERDHRHGRRRPRSRRRRHRLVSLRHVRPALHGGQPRHRPPRGLRRGCGRGSCPRWSSCDSAPGGRQRPTSAPSSTPPRWRRSTRTRRSGSDEGATLLTGGEVATRQWPRRRLLLPADDLRATSRATCASRRRRSSGRRRR